MAWRNRVEVSYAALRANVAALRCHLDGRALIAVVKADAYGLGLTRCARIYHEAGVDALAVASLGEADRLRAALPQGRILLLGSPLPEERPAVVASGYETCCSSREEMLEFAALASRARPHPVHVFIDTGMGRAGCAPDEAVALVALVREHPALRLAGVASHHATAVDEHSAAAQEELWQRVLAEIGPLPPGCWRHIANSEAALLRPLDMGDAVRVGILLPGALPAGCPDPGLVEAVRWCSSVALVKRLPAGHGISYNHLHVLARDSVLALVPVGYADGYPLACSDRSRVLIGGARCPVLGRVTMDYLIADVSDLARPPVPGDPVLLLGRDGEQSITVADLASWAGTIPYDILCGLRGRCEVVGVP